MNLRWLQALRAIMTMGTVTEAANQLCVTQPAVSRMIANLEDELRFKLFLRQRGRLVPTPEGERFYKETEQFLAGIDEVMSAARRIREHGGPRLRLVAMSMIAGTILPEALKQFLERRPAIEVSLEVRGRRDVEQWVASWQFDLGLTTLPIQHQAIESRAFAIARCVAILPRGHPLATHAKIHIGDLVDQPFIALPRQSLIRHRLDGLFAEIGAAPSIRLETSTLHSACKIVAQGLGVTIADPFTTSLMLTGEIEVRELEPEFDLTYGFIYPAARPLSRATQEFTDVVSEAAEAMLEEIRRQRFGEHSGRGPVAGC